MVKRDLSRWAEPWTCPEVQRAIALVSSGDSSEEAGAKLGRSAYAVRTAINRYHSTPTITLRATAIERNRRATLSAYTAGDISTAEAAARHGLTCSGWRAYVRTHGVPLGKSGRRRRPDSDAIACARLANEGLGKTRIGERLGIPSGSLRRLVVRGRRLLADSPEPLETK